MEKLIIKNGQFFRGGGGCSYHDWRCGADCYPEALSAQRCDKEQSEAPDQRNSRVRVRLWGEDFK